VKKSENKQQFIQGAHTENGKQTADMRLGSNERERESAHHHQHLTHDLCPTQSLLKGTTAVDVQPANEHAKAPPNLVYFGLTAVARWCQSITHKKKKKKEEMCENTEKNTDEMEKNAKMY